MRGIPRRRTATEPAPSRLTAVTARATTPLDISPTMLNVWFLANDTKR